MKEFQIHCNPRALPEQIESMRRLLLTLYEGERDGMVAVVGWPPSGVPIAFALGIEDEAQLQGVADMARVLFEHAQVDVYAVAMPAWAETDEGAAQEVVVIQAFAPGIRQQCTCRVEREAGALTAMTLVACRQQFTPWLGDLSLALERVPGQMLRRIQDAYAQARIDLPMGA